MASSGGAGTIGLRVKAAGIQKTGSCSIRGCCLRVVMKVVFRIGREYRTYAMSAQKYSVNQHLIETLLTWVKSGEIAIPEIQRPFVWDATKVRDLMDSLYQGFPVGYIIAWRNPTVKLKDGSLAEGKKVLIDGQQRVTALTAAIAGQQVVNQDYQ